MAFASLDSLRQRADAVLIDLDGTLLDGTSRVTPRTVRAVRRLVDAGIRVVLCTGRSAQGTLEAYDAMDLEGYVVALNGSWIGHPRGEPQRHILLSDHALSGVYEYESRAHFSFRYYECGKYTVQTDHPEHPKILEWYKHPTTRVVQHIHDMPSKALPRVTLFFEADDAAVHQGWSALEEQQRSQMRREIFPLNIFPEYRDSRLWLIELQAASRGKAEALSWLQQEHDVDPKRVVAIGDHQNDVPMLKDAGFAVVMANGVNEAKAHADIVVGHHAQEGLAQWIESGAPLDARSQESTS